MNKRLSFLLLVFALTSLSAASLTQVTGAGLTFAPTTGKPLPVWNGDTLLSLDAFTGARPTVSMLDSRGAFLGSVTFAIPGAKVTGILAIAGGSGGVVAAGGWTSTDDGKTAEILAIGSSATGTVNVVRVDPFAIKQLAIAPDGTIWAQGFMGRNRDNITDVDPQHGVIRHFDASGRFLGSFYPQANLDNRLRTMMGFLAAVNDRVGWISYVRSAAGVTSSGYVEVGAKGSVREFPLPPLAAVRGLAFTRNGAPVAHIVAARGSQNTPERSAIMTLDRNSSVWSALEAPDGSSMAGKALLGASKDSIVIWDIKSQQVNFFTYQ